MIYSIRDQSGERTFNIDYCAVFTNKVGNVKNNNKIFAGRFVIICLTGVFMGYGAQFIDEILSSTIITVSFVGIFGLLFCNLFNIFAVRFILVPLIPPPPEAQGHLVRVIDDAQAAPIIAELDKRRKLRMKAVYGRADLTRDPVLELARMKWLRDNDVLSIEEFELETSRIEGGRDSNPSLTRRERLN